MFCRLCHSEIKEFYVFIERVFYQCVNCRSVQVDANMLPSLSEEKQRYGLHQNTIEDKGYVSFLTPLVNAVADLHSKFEKGLDFGSGPEPVLTQMLQKRGYNIEAYDPVFLRKTELLKHKYDYIICCEVIEHFHNPDKEFSLLSDLLERGGSLLIKTNVLTEETNFGSWWYKNDITHVFFYTSETLKHISNACNFSELTLEKDYIRFKK